MKKSLKFCKSKNGFTLVELVIVIAIVIILSVISVPIYRGYVDKAKMSEGYALLGSILSAQKAYFSEHGNFLLQENSCSKQVWTSNETVLGIDGRGNKYFTHFFIGDFGSGAEKTSFHFGVVVPQDLRKYSGKSLLEGLYSLNSGVTYSQNWY